MKSISVSDLQVVPELAHLRMLDFINPANDFVIAPYLRMLGLDTDYAIQYVASQHRNMQGKVVIGYQLVGELELNESFLRGPFATTEDRVIAAGYKDLSLADQMSRSLSTGREYDSGVSEGFPQELSNPDEQDILDQITVLQNLIPIVRPEMRKEDGSLKTFAEYHAPPEAVKKERKKRSSKVAS